MNTPRFHIELLDRHDRTGFDCGVDPLNDYLRTRVGQDVRRRVTLCYVAIESASGRLAGYYTLAACGVSIRDPPEITKRLPRYPTVPAVRVGRLAIDRAFQGQGLGGVVLFDALERTCRSGLAAFALIVDANDERAVAFYEHFGFQRFASVDRTLFLLIDDALRKLPPHK